MMTMTQTEKRVSFTAQGERVSFTAKKAVTKKPVKCSSYRIGEQITRTTKTGRKTTLERVAKHGANRNLCWEIVGNKKARKSA